MKTRNHQSKHVSLDSDWMSNSLEVLENDSWGEIPENESYLVTSCHRLRKKPLSDFTVEDLRMLVSQNIGLKFLIPIALDILKSDALAEGHLYPGDLLLSVLKSNKDFWNIELQEKQRLVRIFKSSENRIKEEATRFSTARNLIKAFDEFERLEEYFMHPLCFRRQ